ncbi:MAG: OadG family transporter subunit [Bacteroidales bacterium]|jgi:Na+-transporting methylmalonyl-CoA/oxaloacetate decarboxylase gamma subunit
MHKSILKSVFVIILLAIVSVANGQVVKKLFINEILVHNETNYIDDYGERVSWIEVFNADYNYVDMGGMYLTNDSTNPTKYWIPPGDPRTLIPPRNFVVFFADAIGTRGILHLNFTLTETNYIALYDVNGRTKVDEIIFGEQIPDITYGRLVDGGEEFGMLEKTTPGASNFVGEVITKNELFSKMDPYGLGLAVIAMSVVFTSLILLYLLFKNTKKLYSMNIKSLFKPKKNKPEVQPAIVPEISGEVIAAISMALHLYTSSVHDNENTVLTIKQVTRTYSPWSSKVYGLTRDPRA